MWRLLAALLAVWGAPELAFAQASEQEWLARGFERVAIETIDDQELAVDSDVEADLALSVSLVRLAGSNWTHERVLRHARRTAKIFAQCGIAIGPVEIIEARAPNGRHDLDMATPEGLPAPRDVMDLSAMLPESALRPPVFFAGRLHGDEALARSYRRGELPFIEATKHPYLDTSWIAFKTHWIERKDDAYSTVAHELAHLLCECGHERSKQRHLLNRYRNFLSADIQPETCAAMRASPLLRPLQGLPRAVE